MSSSGLWYDIKNNPLALIVAIGLHVVMIVLLSMNLVSSEVHAPKRTPQKTVEAVVVDAAQVDREIAKLRQKEQDKKKKLDQEKNKVKQQIAAEKKRLADLKKKKAAEEKKRLADKKKQADLKKKREVEKKKKLEADKKRKAEQARIAEQKKKDAERKRAQEEEARRKQAEDELKHKIAEEERLEREAKEAAERAAMLDILRAKYISMIEQRVGQSWLRPAGVKTTPECVLHVTQTRLGDVMDVELKNCQGDAVYLRSIERAVRRASPLPAPPDQAVFDREILFTFRPK